MISIKRALIVLIVLFALAIAGCETGIPPEPGTPGGPVGKAISALPPGYASPEGKFEVDQDVVSEPEEKGSVLATVKNEKFVYRYGYILRNNQWEKIEYSGSVVGKSNWIAGKATVKLPVAGEPEGEYWILAYGCNPKGKGWDCNGNLWMIQKYEIIRGLPPEPFAPVEPEYSGLTRYPDILIESQIGPFAYLGSWHQEGEISETSTIDSYFANYAYLSESEGGYMVAVLKFESRQALEDAILSEEDLAYLMQNPTQLDNGYYVYKPQWEQGENFVLWTQDNNLIAVISNGGYYDEYGNFVYGGADISDLITAYLERYPSDVQPKKQAVCGDGVCFAEVPTETIIVSPGDANSYKVAFWNKDYLWVPLYYYLTPDGNIILGSGPGIDEKIYLNGEACIFSPGSIEDCEGARFIITDGSDSTHLMEIRDIDTANKMITIGDLTYDTERISNFDESNFAPQYVALPTGAGSFTLSPSPTSLTFIDERYGPYAYTITKTSLGAELTITNTAVTLTSEKIADSGAQEAVILDFANRDGVLVVPQVNEIWAGGLPYSHYGIKIDQSRATAEGQNEVQITYPDSPIETAENCYADCYPNYLFVVDDTSPTEDVIMIINLISEIQSTSTVPIGSAKLRSEVTRDKLQGMVTTFIYQGQALIILDRYAPTSDVVKVQAISQYLDDICISRDQCLQVTVKFIDEIISDDLRDAMTLNCPALSTTEKQDECYMIFALDRNDFSVCPLISDAYLKRTCYSLKNLRELQPNCGTLPTLDERDSCYVAFALEYDDFSVCTLISDIYLQRTCDNLKNLRELQGMDLGDYPDMFLQDGQFNGYIVVGQNAPTDDVISSIEIASSLQTMGGDTPIEVGTAKTDAEIIDATAQNLIVVGGPCYNSVAAALMGNPDDCAAGFVPNTAVIKLYEQPTGKVALLLAGYSALDTRRAARVLANWQDYAPNLDGRKSVFVTGTTLTDIIVSDTIVPGCGNGLCQEEETTINCPSDCAAITPTCTDSDGGKDYYVKGTVEIAGTTATDFCWNYEPNEYGSCEGSLPGCVLAEHSCSVEGNQIKEKYQCPYGCSDGACIAPVTTCTDSDGGLYYYVKGTASQSGFDYDTDWCESNVVLREGICDYSRPGPNYLNYVPYTCPYGCSDGACIPAPAP